MAEEICEKARVSAMAIADGHTPELTVDEIETHIAGCSGCRGEIERMRAVMSLLDAQKRRELPVNLWSRVEGRLMSQKASHRGWRIFLIAALLLLGYKVIELASERDLGLAFKIVPLIIAIAVFAYLKENPFKINMELKLEGE